MWYLAANFCNFLRLLQQYYDIYSDEAGLLKRLECWLKAVEEGRTELDHGDDNYAESG